MAASAKVEPNRAADCDTRRAALVELDPACCDVILARYEESTCRSATLEEDGRSFAEVRAERLAEAEGHVTDAIEPVLHTDIEARYD